MHAKMGRSYMGRSHRIMHWISHPHEPISRTSIPRYSFFTAAHIDLVLEYELTIQSIYTSRLKKCVYCTYGNTKDMIDARRRHRNRFAISMPRRGSIDRKKSICRLPKSKIFRLRNGHFNIIKYYAVIFYNTNIDKIKRCFW